MASSLFSYGDVRNHPHRSGFDLSRRICFTSKAGELLPVYYKLVYPGDKFQIRHQLFTRTQPVNTAAYTRIREYLDWYFVPLRLINKNLPQALMNMQNNPVQASGIGTNKIVTNDIPYCALGSYNEGYSHNIWSLLYYMYHGNSSIGLDTPVLNFFGFNTGTCGAKLAMMLRYGNFVPSNFTSSTADDMSLGLSSDPNFSLQGINTRYSVNILPFAAYQKIYADHFRISQWEQNEPYTYNFDWYSGGPVFQSLTGSAAYAALKDYVSGNNLFTLRYANWPKDLFMGVMPNSQLGDVSVVDIIPSSDRPSNLIGNVVGVNSQDVDLTGQIAMNKVAGSSTGEYNLMPTRQPGSAILKTIISNPSLQASFTVLQLRMAEAVQRYREVAQVADQTARDQIYAHFGVTLSPALSDTCFRVGGSASNIDISEVVNTFLSPGTETEANIKGKGVGSGQGGVNFSSDEYGILMAIYHVVPLLDYVITGQPQELLYTNTVDLPFPEFDSIGMQSLHFGRFFNYKTDAFAADPTGSVMGYTPRFIDLKTDYDEVYGAFRSTLKSWVAPLDPEYLSRWVTSTISPGESTPTYSLNYGFFKVNPSVLDSIFKVAADSSMDTDQFLSSLYLDVKAVRNFDYDGMPY
uniref:Major capsid protein n=2 Tax=unclassified Microvirus TaxID=338099 RepID=A0AAU8B1P2_9VIRU